MPKRRGAGAIILNPESNKILLIRGRVSNKWGPPKGGIKSKETTLNGAIREVEEETGIDLKKLFSDDDLNNLPKMSIDRVTLYLVNISEKVKLNIKDTVEISDIGWFSLDYDFPGDITTKLLKNVYKRIHNGNLRKYRFHITEKPDSKILE